MKNEIRITFRLMDAVMCLRTDEEESREDWLLRVKNAEGKCFVRAVAQVSKSGAWDPLNTPHDVMQTAAESPYIEFGDSGTIKHWVAVLAGRLTESAAQTGLIAFEDD